MSKRPVKTIQIPNGECMNGHGSLHQFNNPPLVFVGAEADPWADNLYDHPEAVTEVPWAVMIPQVCLECGYHVTLQLTQDEFEASCREDWKFVYE